MTKEFQPKFNSVMIIDDSEIDLYLASHIIAKNKFSKKILQYQSAQDALDFLHKNHQNIIALPDVIFVDIYMPLMSGFEFMEAYDKLPVSLKSHCRVFVVSSTIDERDINRIRSDKNISAFFEKPLKKELLQTI